MAKILVVDDTPELLKQLKWAASEGDGREVVTASTAAEAIKKIKAENFDVVVTDLKLKEDDPNNKEGMRVLAAAKAKDLFTQVIVITAFARNHPEASIKAMRAGAYDFMDRTVQGINFLSMLEFKINQAIERRARMLKGKLKLQGEGTN